MDTYNTGRTHLIGGVRCNTVVGDAVKELFNVKNTTKKCTNYLGTSSYQRGRFLVIRPTCCVSKLPSIDQLVRAPSAWWPEGIRLLYYVPCNNSPSIHRNGPGCGILGELGREISRHRYRVVYNIAYVELPPEVNTAIIYGGSYSNPTTR